MPGEDYLVDCADESPPRRMRFEGVVTMTGTWRFVDRIGARVDLAAAERVWPVQPELPHVPPPPPPPVQPAPAAASTVAPAVGGRKKCPGPGVVNISIAEAHHGKVICPLCTTVKDIPKEAREAAAETVMFPGHLQPAGFIPPAPPPPPPPPSAPPAPPLPVEAVQTVVEDPSFEIGKERQTSPREEEIRANYEKFMKMSPPPPPPPPGWGWAGDAPPLLKVECERCLTLYLPGEKHACPDGSLGDVSVLRANPGSVLVTGAEVEVLSGLFKGKLGVPVSVFSAETRALLLRLKLV